MCCVPEVPRAPRSTFAAVPHQDVSSMGHDSMMTVPSQSNQGTPARPLPVVDGADE